MGIGQNIRNLRTDAGMSQEELAERLDPPYTRPAVTARESGRAKPRMDAVVQIAELFGVSVADLMGHGGVKPRRSSRRVPVRLMGSVHAGEWSEAVPDGVVAVILHPPRPAHMWGASGGRGSQRLPATPVSPVLPAGAGAW